MYILEAQEARIKSINTESLITNTITSNILHLISNRQYFIFISIFGHDEVFIKYLFLKPC